MLRARKEELLEILHRLSAGDGGGTSAGSEPWRVALQGALDRFDRTAVEQLIAGMLSKRAEWLPNLPQLSGEALVPKIEARLAAIVAEELAAAAGTFPL